MSIASNWRTRDQLLRVVRHVRRRWRLKLVLRGLALTLAGTLLTFLISASTLEFLRFEPGAVTAFRVVLWLVVGFFVIRSVLWPLLRRVSDERVALYLEENEPSLPVPRPGRGRIRAQERRAGAVAFAAGGGV